MANVLYDFAKRVAQDNHFTNSAPPPTLPSTQRYYQRKCVCLWGPICEELQLRLTKHCVARRENHLALGLARISSVPSTQRLLQAVSYHLLKVETTDVKMKLFAEIAVARHHFPLPLLRHNGNKEQCLKDIKLPAIPGSDNKIKAFFSPLPQEKAHEFGIYEDVDRFSRDPKHRHYSYYVQAPLVPMNDVRDAINAFIQRDGPITGTADDGLSLFTPEYTEIMDRPLSPASSPSVTTSPPSSPAPSDPDIELQQQQQRLKKKPRKKRKQAAAGFDEEDPSQQQQQGEPSRKKKPKTKRGSKEGASKGERSGSATAAAGESSSGAVVSKKPRKQSSTKRGQAAAAAAAAVDRSDASSPAQVIVDDQMRKALEEDQYSAIGSIVDTDSDSDDHEFMVKGRPVRLDHNAIMSAMRKRLWMERVSAAGSSTSLNSSLSMGGSNINHATGGDEDELDEETDHRRGGRKKKKKKGKRKDDGSTGMGSGVMDDDHMGGSSGGDNWSSGPDAMDLDDPALEEMERDEGSIFGQTTGNSNSIWVECDKCKKWRRLRGVVDEKKLPSKWYCSMNKNDPDRARCSAPEEEYDTTNTPESAADARTRKHLRVWVRRLQCNEAYESRQPALTRGKKRAAATSSKEPYEWVRCCNPSCGKWRAILRIMDAKNNVMDRTADGEWYCVMNTWDEKTASCAAPQENLPAVGCPPWVMQDE